MCIKRVILHGRSWDSHRTVAKSCIRVGVSPLFSMYKSFYLALKTKVHKIYALEERTLLLLSRSENSSATFFYFCFDFKSGFFIKAKIILRTGAAHPLPDFNLCGCTRRTCIEYCRTSECRQFIWEMNF